MKIIPLAMARPGMKLAQDLYLNEDDTTPYLRRGFALTEEAIDRLAQQGVLRIYVAEEIEVPRPAASSPFYLLQNARHAVDPPPPVVKPQLRKDALESLDHVFNDVLISDAGIVGAERELQRVADVVDQLVLAVRANRSTLLSIQDLKSYDEYTYHHSLSVAVLSIALGQALDIPYRDLLRLGQSAILHDIGKAAVPAELIQKPARLAEAEFEQVKSHARAGSAFIIDSAAGDEEQWQAVLFHHEKVDGTGYPTGIAGERIPIWSRIISVADVFDALTSARPYRNPVQPADALEYIMGGIGTHFDYDVVCALAKKAALYPVGSLLELSNGQYGLVLNCENPLRPVVEILDSGDVVDLAIDRQYFCVVVRRMIPAGQLAAM
ncbi:HD-GYP domain-containing protein [Ruminococcaceae bacterium OttesenSCG-928-O06]|nr:HD-GYP domain-containing protein [Ruminococcaceae bacterium OttesenSCG-928-O06]